jgi:penicillin V acylase-like amidase (Ntn superfamily)
MEKDLFSKAAFEDLKYLVTEKERVIREKFITIDNEDFELDDLHNTLSEIDAWGNVYVVEPHLGKMLVKYGVLTSAGSMNWPATKGPNFDEFFELVSTHA